MTYVLGTQLVALGDAVNDFRRAEVERICHELVAQIHERAEPVDTTTAVDLLKLLQRKRHIGLVHEVAEALLAHGADTVEVRRRYALALLDNDRIAVAEALLASLPEPVRRTDPEVLGAIGRVHKQRYLTSGPATGATRASDLAAAIQAYATAYRADPGANYYQGINAAALLARAALDRIQLPDQPRPAADAEAIAEDILAGISGAAHPDGWQLATAAESCLVLRRHDDAVEWVARYVGSDAEAFDYASTLRQFQLVWGLDATKEPGRRLLPVLRHGLLQAEGGALSISPKEYTPASLDRFTDVHRTLEERGGTHYERVYGWDRYHPLAWLRQALQICQSVARIEDFWGNGSGTGFVLDGTKIKPEFPALVLLTNAHVVPGSLSPEDAYITFRGLADSGPAAQARVQPVDGDILWISPVRELDACFLALPDDLADVVTPLATRRSFPLLDTQARPRAYVIGHPLGSPDIQLSLHDTLLLAAGDTFAHYRSPTEPGSSGSPVFDDKWQVIALHHGATDNVPGTTDPANEGIRMDRLLAAVRA